MSDRDGQENTYNSRSGSDSRIISWVGVKIFLMMQEDRKERSEGYVIVSESWS